MTVYVMTHKYFEYPLPDGYIPMLLGTENGKKVPKGYLRDDKGDNISSKNASFCELTGLYEIWKNSMDEYMGLAHYRRYFLNKDYHSRFYLYLLILIKGKINVSPISEKKLRNYMKEYDWVIPTEEFQLGSSLKNHYAKNHYIKDLEITREIIKKIYPEYITAFDDVLNKQNKMAPFNMFYTSKEQLDSYCKWLFTILFEVEKVVDVSNYDDFQKRLFGFLSEELFNVWIKKNNTLKVKYLTVYNTHMLSRSAILSRIGNRGRVK